MARPADAVFLMGHWFQVGRPNAATIVAKVVDCKSFGDRPDEKLIDDPVGAEAHPLGAFFDGPVELPVAEGISAPRPLPATIANDELVEQAVGAHKAGVHLPTLLQRSYTLTDG